MKYYVYYDGYGIAKKAIGEEDLAARYGNNPDYFLKEMHGSGAGEGDLGGKGRVPRNPGREDLKLRRLPLAMPIANFLFFPIILMKRCLTVLCMKHCYLPQRTDLKSS
jgi:hypothetical protein